MSKQQELPWIAEARKYIGAHEIPGRHHNSTIVNWLIELRAWWKDDETPWCGTFVAHCLRKAAIPIPKHWYRALAYASCGTKLKEPAYGCLAVMPRKGGGHVGFVVGETSKGGNLLILGGNQSDQVSIAAFPRSRISAYVWPDKAGDTPSNQCDSRYQLPIGQAQLSKKES